MGFFDVLGRVIVTINPAAGLVAKVSGAKTLGEAQARAGETAEDIAASVKEEPRAALQIAAGSILVATGVGIPAGAGLIAAGGIELGAAIATKVSADDPKATTGASVTLDAQRAIARGKLDATTDRPKPPLTAQEQALLASLQRSPVQTAALLEVAKRAAQPEGLWAELVEGLRDLVGKGRYP